MLIVTLKVFHYLQGLKFEFKSIKFHIREPKLHPSLSSDTQVAY